jgi:pilus assembly protein CpaB
MTRRTILLLAALVVAALGTGLIFAYVHNINDKAIADQSPQLVLIAKSEIAAGTSAADAATKGSFQQVKMAKKYVAVGALNDTTPIADQVALSPIYPGQQILSQMFGAAGTTSALPIPKDNMAISVQLTDPARVAGFVEPGSQVSIFATVNPSSGGATSQATRLLLPRVQVIAVGPTTTTSQTTTNTQTGQTNVEQISRAILTLAVSQQQAQQVIFAQQQGQLYFGLLTANSKVAAGKGTDAHNLFG